MTSEVSNFYCETIVYKWNIRRFSAASTTPGQFTRSPDFNVVKNNETFLCHIHLYLNGNTDEDYLFVKFFNDTSKFSIPINLMKITILNDKSCIFCQKLHEIYCYRRGRHFKLYNVLQKMLVDHINHALIENKLVINLEITFGLNILLAPEIQCVKQCNSFIEDKKSKINDDFEHLLDNENFSDVKFIVGDKTIYSHKVILTSRSPVFKVMFEHDMKESRLGKIEITDVKYEVMKELLRFTYASKVSGLDKIAADLLVAADKYSMDDLKALCEQSLFSSLNSDNAIEYLILSSSCANVQLRHQIIQFINDHPDIVEKPEFKALPSDIMYEVVSAVITKQVNSEVFY